jgi:nucleoside-diphosphate-sugar epimerase
MAAGHRVVILDRRDLDAPAAGSLFITGDIADTALVGRVLTEHHIVASSSGFVCSEVRLMWPGSRFSSSRPFSSS